MDPLFRQFKVDRARRIIGENHETGTFLNLPFGRSQQFSRGFHFGHLLKFIIFADWAARHSRPNFATGEGRKILLAPAFTLPLAQNLQETVDLGIKDRVQPLRRPNAIHKQSKRYKVSP